MRHEFSHAKFDENLKPDFKGYPEDPNETYTEDQFDYDQKKLDLTIDRVPDVTKDKVNPKETLKFLEIYAFQKFHESNPSYFNKNQKTNNSLV